MKLITAILILTATIAQAANTFERCWLSPIDDLAAVQFSRDNIRPLHPMGENELPIRARSIQRPTEITGTYIDKIDGTTNNIYTEIPDKYLLWNGTSLVGMTTEQRATRDAYDAQAIVNAETARQAAKKLELKTAENNFFGIASILGLSGKPTFGQINTALNALQETDINTSIVLSIKLLAVDAEAKREGGNEWWDDATYHVEIAE